MKINQFLMSLALIALIGCTYESYLPTYDQIDVNQYGSYIRVQLHGGKEIKGELLAIDRDQLMILTSPDENFVKKTESVPVRKIQKFKLTYANPKKYGWTIPASGLISISHGLFAIFTAPVNIIATSLIASSGENAFAFNNKNMTYDQLYMFARFPQGIPQGINIADLK